MGALGTLLSGLLGRVFFFFTEQVTVKLAILAAVVGAFVSMLAGLTVLYNSLLQSIYVQMPVELQWAMGLLPLNVPVCLSAVVTARIALWVFRVKWAIVKAKAN